MQSGQTGEKGRTGGRVCGERTHTDEECDDGCSRAAVRELEQSAPQVALARFAINGNASSPC